MTLKPLILITLLLTGTVGCEPIPSTPSAPTSSESPSAIASPTPSESPTPSPTTTALPSTGFERNNRWVQIPKTAIGPEGVLARLDTLSLTKRDNRITFEVVDGEQNTHKMRAVCSKSKQAPTIEILATNGKRLNSQPSEPIRNTLPGEAAGFVCKTYGDSVKP